MRISIIIALFLVSITAYGQDEWDEVRVYEDGMNSFTRHELGITYSSSSVEGGVGILYKYQLSDDVFLRGGIEGFGRKSVTNITKNYNNGLGIRVGVEKRSWMGTDLYWNYGVNVGAGAALYETSSVRYNQINLSGGLVGGLNYIMRDNFVLGFEIVALVVSTNSFSSDDLPNNVEKSKLSLVFPPTVNVLYRFNSL